MCTQGRNRAHALRFCRIILTSVNVKSIASLGDREQGPPTLKVENFLYLGVLREVLTHIRGKGGNYKPVVSSMP